MSQLTISFPVEESTIEIPFLDDEQIPDQSRSCRSFADELYPTTDAIIDCMLEPYVKHILEGRSYLQKDRILDPSAGKGNILDRIKDRFMPRYGGSSKELFAIEIQQDLRHILSDKEYTVLDADFTEFNDPVKFDLIIMNPAFSLGAKHLLHAWEFLDYGGDLVCLLNKETIANPYNNERKHLLALIEKYGSIEDLGQCFQNSERPTNVEVVMVRLARLKLEGGYSFEGFKFEVDKSIDFSEFGQNPLADRNIIKTLVKHQFTII